MIGCGYGDRVQIGIFQQFAHIDISSHRLVAITKFLGPLFQDSLIHIAQRDQIRTPGSLRNSSI